LTTGPTISIDQDGCSFASPPTSARSSRSSITPKKPSRGGPASRACAAPAPCAAACRRPRAKWTASTLLGKQRTRAWRCRLASYRLAPPVKTRSAISNSMASRGSSCGGACRKAESSSMQS
jgi:hypothetical protein